MPTEGRNARRPRAAGVARTDVPTCRLDERLADVRSRVEAAGWDACVVVNDERIVLGLLRSGELAGTGEQTIDQAMRPGPSTFRPHVPIAEMASYLQEHDVDSSPITTSDGRLIGLLRRADAAEAAHRAHGGEDDG